MTRKKLIVCFFILTILSLNLALGLPRLSRFSAVDEPYWTYGRISKFWNAIQTHKWKSTNVNDKPGITVAILSGAGLWKFEPMNFKSLRGDIKTDAELQTVNDINFFFRLPIFLFTLLLLPLFYFFLKKLFDAKIALLGFIFIGLSPILLGMSLIINPDSLLWLFLPLSLLAYFVFQKEGNKKYLYTSGVLLGLSLLTKYVANILYIFFFMLPFLEYVFMKKKPELTSYLKKSLFDYLELVAISMTVFFFLYPAAWVNAHVLLEGTFLSKAFKTTWPLFVGLITLILFDIAFLKNKATKIILDKIATHQKIFVNFFVTIFLVAVFVVLFNTYLGMRFFDFVGMLSSPKGVDGSPTSAILSDFYSLIFGINPLILAALVFGLVKIIFQQNNYSREELTIFYFAVFILFYYAASTINNVTATVRYQITLYPLIFIMGALSLGSLMDLIGKKIKKDIPTIPFYCVLIAILTFSLLSVKPFYFVYASDLLPKKYLLNYKDMGDGSFEIGSYLNNLPNARSLTIWSDKGAVCEEFIGKCVISLQGKDLEGIDFDYFVVSSGRFSKTSKKKIPTLTQIFDFSKAYTTESYTQKITLGDRLNNYVKIVPADIVVTNK